MAEIPKEMKPLLFGMGAKWHAWAALVLDYAGLACVILGVIAAATDKELGLSATHWLLTAIALILFAMWSWQTAYHAAKNE